MATLSGLLQEARQATSGSTVTDDGSINIAPAQAGQPTVIATNSGTPVITAADNGDITLGSGEIVRQVVSTINDVDPNNDTNLSNVTAIVNRINSAVSGALTFVKIDSKAAFDTFLSAPVIDPSSVLVTDTTPFDYTDTNGVVNIQITYWQGIVTKPTAGDTLSSNTLATSNSANSMTGSEIAAALFVEPDTNNLTNARATVTDTIEATLTSGLSGKVDTVSGQGLSNNNFTDALLTRLNNTPLDTNGALSDKLDKNSVSINASITNDGSGSGSLEFINTSAPVDQKSFVQLARSDGTFDFEARSDDGTLQNRWTFSHAGISSFPAQIIQAGNNVLDTSDTKYINLPADTTTVLSGKVDTDGDKVLSDNNFTDVEKTKLSGLSNFNGGTVTGSTVFQTSSPVAISLKVNDNDDSTGIAFQNSGNNYTGNIVRNSLSGFSVFSGNESDISNLSLSVTFDSSGVANFTGAVNANGGLTATTITATGNIIGNNLVVQNQGDLLFSNTTAPANQRNSRIRHDISGIVSLDLLNGSGATVAGYSFGADGNFKIESSLSLNDGSSNEYILDSDTNGLILRPKSTNPSSGDSILSIQSSGGSERLSVEHDGSITSSNNNLWLGTESNGAIGGRRVLKIRDIHYENIPTLTSGQIVEEWLGNSVYFIGAGVGTINMPTIVASNPTAAQFQAGDYFYIYNFNTGLDITLSPAPGQNQWMRDNVGDVITGDIVLGPDEVFKVSVANITDFTDDLGFVIRRISEGGGT